MRGFTISIEIHEMADSFVPTTYPSSVSRLIEWVNKWGAIGLDGKSVRYEDSSGKGLGCFANKDFAPGDTIFSLPRKCILGIGDIENSILIKRIQNELDAGILTSELLLWLFMCEQRDDPTAHFYPYLSSLTTSPLPSIICWDDDLLCALLGTNIELTCRQAKESIAKYDDFAKSIRELILRPSILKDNKQDSKRFRIDETLISKVSRESLTWARTHYISRRFSGRFSASFDPLRKDQCREVDMGNLGALCPVLDICNHDSSRDWIQLVVDDDFLHLRCNHPIAKDTEIFFNYGTLSNEVLLYGYGYAVEDNPDDSVALLLRGGGRGTPSDSDTLGTFYMKAGGFEGIPKVSCSLSLTYYQSYVSGTLASIEQVWSR